MSNRANVLANRYELLSACERLRLLLEAQGREDFDEVNRLRRSCPRKVYRTLDHQFDAADEAVKALTFALCIDLAMHLGIIAGSERFARCSGGLFLIAGGEAVEDLVATVWPDYREPAVELSDERLAAGTRLGEWWNGGDFESMLKLAAERTPAAHAGVRQVHEQGVKVQVARIRAIVEGLSRFTRRVLGLEGLDVIRAWMPTVARRIEALPSLDVAVVEAEVADVERIAWKYWNKIVRPGL